MAEVIKKKVLVISARALDFKGDDGKPIKGLSLYIGDPIDKEKSEKENVKGYAHKKAFMAGEEGLVLYPQLEPLKMYDAEFEFVDFTKPPQFKRLVLGK